MGDVPVPIIQRSAIALPYLVTNTDLVNNLYIGTSSSLAPAATNTFTIQPLGAISLSSGQQWWACTDKGQTINVAVLPGGTTWAPAPSQIAEVIAPLATAIAQAIFQQGIQVVAAPKLLYNGSIQTAGGTNGGWGVTVSDNVPGLYAGCSGNTAASFQCAHTAFDGFTGKPSNACKIFFNPQEYDLTVTNNKLQAAINLGYKRIYLCYQPGATPVTGTVTGINQTTTDQNNLLASINAMITACGASAAIAGVILFQEYNDQNTNHKVPNATFQSGWNYYANFLHANLPSLKIFACVGSGTSSAWNTCVNTGLTFISGLLVDFYATAYIKGTPVLLDSGQNGGAAVGGINNNIIAIATALSIPWGVGELGNTATGTDIANPQTNMPIYFNYIQNVILSWLKAGFNMLDCMWFDGQNPTGVNVVATATDYRVPLIAAFVSAITTPQVSGILSGATQSLPPLTGSPVGNYATANSNSYDITVNLITSALSTVPFAIVSLSWFNQDSLTAQPVAEESWILAAGATGTAGTFTIGVGPQKAAYLQIAITNLDSVQMSVTIELNSTSRTVAEDRWWWDIGESVAVPTYTNSSVATLAADTNLLGQESSLAIPPSPQVTHLCGMFAGPVYFRYNGGSSGKVTATLKPVPAAAGYVGTPTVMGGSALVNEQPVGEFETILYLPRAPTTITFSNSDSSSHNIDFEMVALR